MSSESNRMELCEWCKKNSGMTHADRPCCQGRLLANMPEAMRRAAYQQASATGGKQALERLRRLKLEYQAIALAKAPKDVRVKAYQAEGIEGSTETVALLKQLVMDAYRKASSSTNS